MSAHVDHSAMKEDEFLAAAFSVSGALVCMLDTEGRVVKFNTACERVTGRTFAEVKGKHFWDLFLVPEEVDSVRAVFGELRAGQFPNQHENYWLTKTGDRVRIMWSNTALVGSDGGVEFVIGTGIDVTECRKAEERLRAHRENLEELVKERAAEIVRTNKTLEEEIKVRRKAEEDLREALLEVARLKDRLEAENLYLQEEIKRSHDFEEIVGESAALQSVLQKVQQVAATDASVLITGETGTGKELLARAIHSRSSRKDRPLVRVNCSALPGSLIENELFGHEKGAFTGALAKKIGRFELANGGTILLDEIGDLSPDIQVKLLRVLQEGEFERIGSTKTIKVDVRVIAATNRELARAVADGSFRSDLYYRLNVFPIHVPPLRERMEDIPLLVSHIIRNKKAKIGKTIEEVPREVIDEMMSYDWPGNVRELENVIAHSAILSPGVRLQLCELFGPGHGMHGPHALGARVGGGAGVGAGSAAHTHNPAHIARAGRMVRNIQGMGEGPTAGPEAAPGYGPLAPTDVPGRISAAARDGAPETLRALERAHIQTVVEKCGWKISGKGNAADLLGLNASTLRSRMKKLGVVRPKDKTRAQGRAKR